eukprot:376918-Prymnesium_polylepis.1
MTRGSMTRGRSGSVERSGSVPRPRSLRRDVCGVAVITPKVVVSLLESLHSLRCSSDMELFCEDNLDETDTWDCTL